LSLLKIFPLKSLASFSLTGFDLATNKPSLPVYLATTGANPTTASYNAMSSLVRFEHKNIFSTLKKALVYHDAVEVVHLEGLALGLEN
jgi:hypothetical protein